MNSLFALTIIFVIYAIGDIVSTKTHAIVSMLLIISVIFALAFWNNWLPGTIFTDSNLKAFGDVTVGLLLVHMGTTIRIRDFIEQYKTVIIVLCLTLAICIGVYFISKIFHESWYLCCAMNITALFGFPGTVIVPTEVTKAVAETEDEKKLIQGSIMPKMIISGMVSVSVVSVVVAGIMSAWA